MRIIEIAGTPDGAHRNQTINGVLTDVPEGWAVVPNSMDTPHFPFGEIEVADIDDISTVTGWTPLPVPEPEAVKMEEPTQLDRLEAQATYTAMMTDTLLEV